MDSKPDIKKSTSYQPSLWIRLVCWFGIIFATAYFSMSCIAYKPVSGGTSVDHFWVSAHRIPEDLQLFFVGSLGLPPDGSSSHFFLFLAYGCFLINLVLCLVVSDKKKFWSLIIILLVLILLGFFASSIYVRTVFETIPNPQIR
jgi:hypothetical protein